MEELIQLLKKQDLLSTVKKVGSKFKFKNNPKTYSLLEINSQIFKTFGLRVSIEDLEKVLIEACKNNKVTEKDIRDRLAKELKGQVEVKTDAGYIDVLTEDEVIEVKEAKKWKAAIGQVISYGEYYKDKIKRIHLYGDVGKGNLDSALQVCRENSIKLTYENIL